MDLEVDALTDASEVRIRLHGELDLTAIAGLRAAIDKAITAPDRPAVTVDLWEVTYLDCAVLGELLRGRALALGRGLRYQVIGARGLPLRVMEITETLPLLTADGSG